VANNLQQALGSVQNYLSAFANSAGFWSGFQSAFGTGYNRGLAGQLQGQ
jgi:hypothetical protein